MASLVVAMHIKVWLSLPVKLRSGIDCLVRIVDLASHAMTTIVAAIGAVVTRRVPSIVMIVRHPLDQSAENSSANHCADVMTAMVIHAGIGIKAVATSMVVAADIGENSGATLRDPNIFAAWIVAPGPVQNTRTSRSLMNELRLAQRARPAFAILIVPRLAFDGRLCAGIRDHPR
ncbi:hypothetical protein A4R28_22410 [Mesorhizobium ciceri]|nr:hypothetical protein A4R28_22410 [Mesorhizobium ciceri]